MAVLYRVVGVIQGIIPAIGADAVITLHTALIVPIHIGIVIIITGTDEHSPL